MYIESVPNRDPRPAARHPPARVLPPRRQGPQTHPRQPLQVAARPRRRPQDPAQGRHRARRSRRRVDILRSRPRGHVAAVLGTLRKLRLDRALAAVPSPQRQRAVALVAARILAPGSKLATARGLAADTARDSLAEILGIDDADENDLYAAMDRAERDGCPASSNCCYKVQQGTQQNRRHDQRSEELRRHMARC